MFKVAYFFEDAAHEHFIRELVKRMLQPEDGQAIDDDHVLNRRRGSAIINAFRTYMNGWKKSLRGSLEYDLIVVVHDQNCHDRQAVEKKFRRLVKQAGYPEDRVAYAIPDPYIERWYLADSRAFIKAIDGNAPPPASPYVHKKGKENFYKDKVYEALRANGIYSSSQAGAEFGDDIASHLNVDLVGEVDSNFKRFIEDLKRF